MAQKNEDKPARSTKHPVKNNDARLRIFRLRSAVLTKEARRTEEE